MFPSDWGMSSLTTSVTRLHLCLVWRLRAACWWEESHWLGSVWLVRLASESRRENSIASLAHHNWHWLSSNSGRSLHAAVESVMLSPSCWVSQDESIVSCLSCLVCHVDSVILSLSCRVRHVESVILSLSCWVRHVEVWSFKVFQTEDHRKSENKANKRTRRKRTEGNSSRTGPPVSTFPLISPRL